jgi:hypothetical protein
MAKILIGNISSGFASTSTLNTAFDAIEAELNNKVLYRDNPSGEPNQMENDIDMNGNKIINVESIEVNGVDVLTEMNTIYNDYEALTSRVTVSTAAPSGGSNGDIWFKVSA